ncbi:MAG: DUF2330 domain-containing protein [Myxococcota bacterium]
MRNPFPAVLAAAACAPMAYAFCGFYVAQEPGSLFNHSSKVVLVRDGDHTVLTMANDYQGDPEAFGLVVPVPQEITPDMVKIGDRAMIDKLDQYTIPRLAEYWDPDPCPEPMKSARGFGARMAPMAAAPMEMAAGSAARDEDYGVTVEQAYSLEEYDIVVIQARDGAGLEQWLAKEGYRIPDGASSVLQSYIRQNMHFFLAKIDLSAQKELGVKWPRPLRVAYDSPKFMLPIRLGTVNADGAQDLLVFALTKGGRVETTNYRTARMPTDLNVPEYIADGGNFATFYTATFDRKVARDAMSAVYLEYAWPISVQCDPCSGEQLSGAELQALGASWATDYHGGVEGGFVTRLHVRYDRAHFPEDLVFQETADAEPWQVRYVVNHAFTGDTRCAEGRRYELELLERRADEVANLARLTGWSSSDIRTFVPTR